MNATPIEVSRYLNVGAKLEHPNYWYNTISNLQKATRRGDVDHVMISATLLYDTDPIKLLRRLCVIALEDVGFGSIKLAARTLEFAATHKSATDLESNASTLVETLGLAAELARSPKDRSPCQLAVAAKRNDKAVQRIARLSAENCASIFANSEEDIQLRCVAGRSLTGNLTLNNQRIGSANRKVLACALGQMGLPKRIVALAEYGVGLGGEVAGLAMNIPILYPLMRLQSRRICVNQLPPTELIRGLLSPAYDQHTLEGKWALSAFAAKCHPLRQFSENIGIDAKKIIGLLVFMAEGAVVDRCVRCALMDQHYGANERALCQSIGLPYDALPDAKRILLENLTLLNHCRRQIAEATSYFDNRREYAKQGVLI